MTPFDPAAATAAYLSALTPAQHTKAVAYTQGGHWLLLWGAVVAVAVSWIVLRSGYLVRLGDWIGGGKSRPWRVAVVVLAADAVIEAVIGLPWTIYTDWWRETAYGLKSQPFPDWLGEWGLQFAIASVVGTLLLAGLYALMRRAPKTWWLWGGGLVGAVFVCIIVLSPVYVEPLFNKFTPAPPGPVRDMVVEMARANGVPSDKVYIYNGSKQSNRYTANVSGLFGTARVAMSDVMFKKDADLAEVKGVVGHEMGHYVHRHSAWIAGAYGALALIGFFLVDRLFPLVAGAFGARGVRGIADPAGYPVLGIILAVLGLLSTPVRVSLTRIIEADADHFSLERFNEPDGLAKALVKTIEYRAATPSKLEETLFYDHPAVGNRVRTAMDWKAAHPKPGP